MELAFLILGIGIGITMPRALDALKDWISNHPENHKHDAQQ